MDEPELQNVPNNSLIFVLSPCLNKQDYMIDLKAIIRFSIAHLHRYAMDQTDGKRSWEGKLACEASSRVVLGIEILAVVYFELVQSNRDDSMPDGVDNCAAVVAA